MAQSGGACGGLWSRVQTRKAPDAPWDCNWDIQRETQGEKDLWITPSLRKTSVHEEPRVVPVNRLVLLVKSQTLDFGISHNLRVLKLSLVSGSMLSVEPAWDSLSDHSLLLPLPSPCFR